ncbi:MFS general substrate transporter [Lecanosticta acicola]|uniref:MFS general substrate transporter n=1 Tax=Lecanosticta acicola TaxID=111012 RepID=A0AAI8Z2M3_9PEZI|nr:MFS general substrate transporter [Lecanosticta acicola]
MAVSAKHRERKLPVQQLSILAICRFAEPISSTSLYPYLPEMVESFQVPQNEVGKWAGICAAVFSLFQALMGIPWGRFSDKYGRKPAILLGLTSTMFTSLLWGFSKNLPMAIVARALAGAGNGNVGIIRTTVAEMVPFKELQPRAFSLMPLVWNIGSIFGPTIGGSLANPFKVKPGEQRDSPSFLEVFPYALPNIVSACFFTVGITTGLLFLEETLETARGRRDWGLTLGTKLTKFFKRHSLKLGDSLHARVAQTNGERDPLLKHRTVSEEDEEDGLAYETKAKPAPPSWRDVLNRQAVINLIVYALLAMHAMAFDQLIPVFAQHSPLGTPDSTPYSPPLKFAGGFGLDSFQIGLMSTGYGVAGMVVQFFVFPPLARKYGVLFWLKVVACAFPIIYFITPFTALLPTTRSQVGCMFTVMLLKCLCGIFAFPCSTILLTNSAASLRTLGTLNGIATSVSAVGRAAGPAMAGAMFTVGVKRGYVIAPWWFLTAVALIAAVPVFWLVEGEGFGGDDEVSDDEEHDEEEDGLRAAALEGEAENRGKAGPIPPPVEDEEHEERAYGGLAPLSRTNTQASSAMLSDDEAGPASRTVSRKASGLERTTSQDQAAPPTLSRRGSRRVTRRMSIPIGMGRQGISRRYSSNLGQSFGSAGSYQ